LNAVGLASVFANQPILERQRPQSFLDPTANERASLDRRVEVTIRKADSGPVDTASRAWTRFEISYDRVRHFVRIACSPAVTWLDVFT
jgi:hypothetical protein